MLKEIPSILSFLSSSMISDRYEEAKVIFKIIEDIKFVRSTRRSLRRKWQRNLIVLHILRFIAPDGERREKATKFIELTRAYLHLLDD